MLYRKIRPSTYLHPFVECYYVWESAHTLPEPLEVSSPPNGFAAMVFNYGGLYWARRPDLSWGSVPNCFISGQFTSQYHVRLAGRIGMVGIVFKPAAMATIFGFNMIDFTDQRICLIEALGTQGIDLAHCIAVASSLNQRVQILETFLLEKLKTSRFVLNAADYAVDIILERRGMVTVKAVAEELRVSRRLLEKQFIRKVGLSPKYYARLRRLGVICARLIRQKQIDWQDIVFLGGLLRPIALHQRFP